VYTSRASDVTITAFLRSGRRLTRIAGFRETESQIPRPHARIALRLPARVLRGRRTATIVLRFSALDAAGRVRTASATVTLRR
jgi:hypothetical protein